jgi:hypothetical protein
MWTRIALGILLAIAAYCVVRFFSSEQFTNWDSVIETPAYAPPIREQIPRGNMDVSPGGPNPPNVAAPRTMPATVGVSPQASDPYSETAEDADAPENLRHPERSFSPGIIPETGAIAVAGGIASPVTASSPQAIQTFSPEFIQNGGTFFGTVSAFEDENPNYTAF